uniref:Ovule protein n=1 Tax=Mesocestoides corti TaxID=53468 RepID=A0A5K3G640_MESCO
MRSKQKRRRLSSTTQVITSNRMISAASTDQHQAGKAPDLKRPVRQHLFTIYCMLSGSNTVHPSLYFCT